MRKILYFGAALALPLVMTTAGPAMADSSSCTHHFGGPQICIRLEGRNDYNAVTAIWSNPPKKIKSRAVSLYWNGDHYDSATAKRVGKTLSYRWSTMDTGTNTRLCVRFKGSNRMACETTKYIGNRVNL
ncbi:hypothetical protein ACIRD8_35635 [Streptomyces sp. NPDC102451]|uniref:hypothetical protein n=1 Tax=Streptomyces sp. NPDC102451 TaxID=3366177 RepID=UPI00381F44EF